MNTSKAPATSIDLFQPFPVDALPSPIREFVKEGAAALKCDASFIALPALSVLAAAIGATRMVEVKRNWKVPSILWTAIVGESGDGKSPAFQLALAPYVEIQGREIDRAEKEELAYEGRVAEYEKELKRWAREKRPMEEMPEKPPRPEARRIMINDVTVESVAPILRMNPRGVLLGRDELAGWINSFDQYKAGGRGGADRANWLSMFDGGSITIDRKSASPKTIHVKRSYVSICGGIQPGVLSRSLSQEDRESGLAARILFASPPRLSKKWTDSEISRETEEAYAATVERLLDLKFHVNNFGEPEPILLQFYPDSKDEWIEFYNRHAEEKAALDGDMAAAWSKLEQIPARLAIIIHCVKDETENFITIETMKEAIELTEWFKHECQRVYGMLAESQDERRVRTLIELIQQKDGRISARELYRSSRRYQPTEVAEGALMELVEKGHGLWDVTETGGAPLREFVLFDNAVRNGSIQG